MKLASRRGLFALLAIGLLAAGMAGFFMAGAVAQAQETALPSSYDTDGDGLIEISNLDQLNAVRWDLDGNGTPSRGYAYAVAFPVAAGGSVCPANTTCTGYELITDLDFDADGDGQITAADPYWNGRGGWDPIGTYFISNRRPDTDRPFTGVFDGNGHVIANLYINLTDDLTDDALVNTLGNRHEGVGLFGKIGGSGVVRNLGLPDRNT